MNDGKGDYSPAAANPADHAVHPLNTSPSNSPALPAFVTTGAGKPTGMSDVRRDSAREIK